MADDDGFSKISGKNQVSADRFLVRTDRKARVKGLKQTSNYFQWTSDYSQTIPQASNRF